MEIHIIMDLEKFGRKQKKKQQILMKRQLKIYCSLETEGDTIEAYKITTRVNETTHNG